MTRRSLAQLAGVPDLPVVRVRRRRVGILLLVLLPTLVAASWLLAWLVR